jgi:hypothetical protein
MTARANPALLVVRADAFNLNLSPFLHPRGAAGESRQPVSSDVSATPGTSLAETPDTYGARSGQGYVVKVRQQPLRASVRLAPVEWTQTLARCEHTTLFVALHTHRTTRPIMRAHDAEEESPGMRRRGG